LIGASNINRAFQRVAWRSSFFTCDPRACQTFFRWFLRFFQCYPLPASVKSLTLPYTMHEADECRLQPLVAPTGIAR